MTEKKGLTLGTLVNGLDGGEVGRLERIVADPETHQPSYLVVRHGRIGTRDIVVPVSLVLDASPDRVLIDTTRDTLHTLSDYEITVNKRPEPVQTTLHEPKFPFPWQVMEKGSVEYRARTVPEHTVEFRRGMTVYDQEGVELGRVEGVILDTDKHQASHLVLRQPRSLGVQADARLVAVDLVDFSLRTHIYLHITEDQVQGLPQYTAVGAS